MSEYKMLVIILLSILVIVLYFVFNNEYTPNFQKYDVRPEVWNTEFADAYKNMSEQERITRDKCPKFSHKGYVAMKLQAGLKKRLVTLWETTKHLKTLEDIPSNVIWGTKSSGKELVHILDIKQHDPVLHAELEKYIKTELESWTNTSNLIHTATYGIREYKRGATLKVHCDRYDTHVLSAIIHIAHEQETPWSLDVWDHSDKKEKVYLDENTDLVLYESIATMHGRPDPFMGNSYVNLFIHFKTPGWMDTMDTIFKR
jgi:prolyl 4-hydroxylase